MLINKMLIKNFSKQTRDSHCIRVKLGKIYSRETKSKKKRPENSPNKQTIEIILNFFLLDRRISLRKMQIMFIFHFQRL